MSDLQIIAFGAIMYAMGYVTAMQIERAIFVRIARKHASDVEALDGNHE